MKQIVLILAVTLLAICSKDSEMMAQTMTQKLYITIDGKTLSVELVDNAATQTLVAALQEGDITYEAHDYGVTSPMKPMITAVSRRWAHWDARCPRVTHRPQHRLATSSFTVVTRSCSSMDQTHGVTPAWGVWSIRRRRNWSLSSKPDRGMSW